MGGGMDTYTAAHDEVGAASSALGHFVLVARGDADEFGVLFVARCALELEHERVVSIRRNEGGDVVELRLELQCESLPAPNRTKSGRTGERRTCQLPEWLRLLWIWRMSVPACWLRVSRRRRGKRR